MTVKVLRQHCNKFDLRQTGNKTMLIEHWRNSVVNLIHGTGAQVSLLGWQ